jgi:N-acetylneuraminate synthase
MDFVSKISRHVQYLHIVDAKGSDGEGIQIGDGDVDFEDLGKILGNKCKDIPFIPEIWQGHKNQGAAFWEALDFLEPYFQTK